MLTDKKQYFESMLGFLNQPSLAVNMFFVTRDKTSNAYEVYKGNLSDSVGKEMVNLCLKISTKSYNHSEKKDFKEYDASQKGSTCTEFLNSKEIEKIKPILDLTSAKPIDLKKIDQNFLDSLWFYIIKIESGKKSISFFKKYSKGMVLSKSLGLAVMFKSGEFDRLKNDIFTIYERIDCIYYENNLIIRCKGNFELIFNFFYQIKENALAAIQFVENNIPAKIESLDLFKEEWMNHEKMIRKLNNIYSRKSMEKIKFENIETLIKRGILKKTSMQKDVAGKFLINSNDAWELLSILDDDYVKSMLTDIEYETSSKREINQS